MTKPNPRNCESAVDAIVKPVFIPLCREDYRHGLNIRSKHGKKAHVSSPHFCVRGVDSGWWCYYYKKRNGSYGFLLTYDEMKQWCKDEA